MGWWLVCNFMCVAIREQLLGVGSPHPPCGPQESNPCHLSCQQAPLPPEPSHWPKFVFKFSIHLELSWELSAVGHQMEGVSSFHHSLTLKVPHSGRSVTYLSQHLPHPRVSVISASHHNGVTTYLDWGWHGNITSRWNSWYLKSHFFP